MPLRLFRLFADDIDTIFDDLAKRMMNGESVICDEYDWDGIRISAAIDDSPVKQEQIQYDAETQNDNEENYNQKPRQR